MNSSVPTAPRIPGLGLLPPDDALRTVLHNEVHARPSTRVRLPALIVYVAVLNDSITREAECAHLRQLPGQQDLAVETLSSNFVQLRCEGFSVKWERHTEFTRYSIVQSLPERAFLGAAEPEMLSALVVSADWLRNIPGRTVAAIKLVILHGNLSDTPTLLTQAQQWFGGRDLTASQLGNGHSWALTDFRLAASGFERFLVVAPPDMSPMRAGRVSQRLLELETYRLMALRGLPVAKELGPMLSQAELALADITAGLEGKSTSDQQLLDTLVSLAGQVERAIAQHSYRFSATQAYYSLVTQRIDELREKVVPGTQTIGEFMQRRLSPAIATVDATAQRLASLSERISRTSAMLRTRVDIATELQNQQLLAKLTRGQELQLRLQSTVEGLSIAAITYYVISLSYYGIKALKLAGAPLNPEIATGTLIPLVLWAVWRATQRIHERLQKDG
jgi:uncharacterized membrane-anchored protein